MWIDIFGWNFRDFASVYIYTHVSLIEGATRIFITHISTYLSAEGARKSWFRMKNRFLIGWIVNEKIQSFSTQFGAVRPRTNLFFMWNHNFRASSAERYVLMYAIQVSVAPWPSRNDVYVFVYLCEISKNSSTIYQFKRLFFVTEIFFSKLEQFVRTCSLIVNRTCVSGYLTKDKMLILNRIIRRIIFVDAS